MVEVINTNIVIVTLVLVTLFSVVWKILNDFWFRPKKLEKFLRSQGFKGNPYRLFYGDMKDMAAVVQQAHSKPIKHDEYLVPYIIPYHHQMIQKFEKCFIWYGPYPVLIITDPKMIKDITYKHTIFQRPTLSPLDRLLVTGLFIKEGDEWAKRRKIINPAFTLEKLKNMVPSMYVSCRELVDKWETSIQGKESCEIDVWPDFANLTADVISRTAFGSRFEEGRRIFELQRELFFLIYQCSQTIYIKGSRFLPTKRNRRMKGIFRESNAIMRDLIKKREERMKDEENSEDLLGILLESNLKEIKENGNKKSCGLTTDDVVEECNLFYFAGQETTSNLLVWTMIMLGIHRDWQEKAREEVSQVFGNNELELEGLHRLKIVSKH
ncbi:OLC1v1023366C2 [Oldenlandia corymbosa var. corymbosa]|uniref:OLC1v1023366C2 n=1 Tax=Oldenlandia corymbosa var. corymbosa TaxID=529605 RepID=A0AAV1C0N4_OLDCO|nr:OLC1v1023366C2 [Oldenlandia corymbosa var. corymbosa]